MDQGAEDTVDLSTLKTMLTEVDPSVLREFWRSCVHRSCWTIWDDLSRSTGRGWWRRCRRRRRRSWSRTWRGGAVGLLEVLHAPEVRAVLEELDPDDLADALQALEEHDPEHAAAVKSLLGPEVLAVAEALASYEEEAAGGLMTPEFVSLAASMTVERALEFLREASPDAETIYYLYVVDRDHRLLGVLSLRELIVASPTTRIGTSWTRCGAGDHGTDQEEVARIIADYDLSVLPVVDDDDRLVGIVTVDDVLDVVELEATEDIHRLGAAPVDVDYARARPWLLFRKRVPWLVLLVVSMTLTFNVISHFEDILAEVVILAAFIPLLIGTGGNVGAQVATLVVRALATRDLELARLPSGPVEGDRDGPHAGRWPSAASSWVRAAVPARAADRLALGITMLLIALTANLVGASLPFLFRRLGIDPALTSSPGITTVMDVVGLLIYFHVVIWVLRLGTAA
jgi:magnesium transporter